MTIKSTPLMVNGILYFTSPNNVWAADARTGHELWHYQYPPNTGSTIGNRGVGMYGNWLFFETPDSNLVSLDARTGKERWKVSIADPKLDYTSTVAPVIIGNHVIAGIGGDHLDNPGFIQSRDPETGALQWKWWTTPRKGEPGMETWPDEYASAHGTGQAWMPGTYDPELNLYIVGTGNPNPVMAEQSRKGDNLYTCSIVALNPDTGKMVWYFQASPHDVHDWDAVETPILFDGTIDGQPRKLVAQASRNGYFFVLDRVTGKRLVGAPFIDSRELGEGLRREGPADRRSQKIPTTDGVLVSPSSNGATNWQAPSFSPQTGLFYVGTSRSWSMYYLIDTDDHPEGWGGLDSGVGNEGNALAGARLSDRQSRLAARLAQRRRHRQQPLDRREAAVHQQRPEPDRVRCRQRKDPVALRLDGRAQRGADHLHAGWQAIYISRRGGQSVRIYRQPRGGVRTIWADHVELFLTYFAGWPESIVNAIRLRPAATAIYCLPSNS